VNRIQKPVCIQRFEQECKRPGRHDHGLGGVVFVAGNEMVRVSGERAQRWASTSIPVIFSIQMSSTATATE